MSSQNCSFQLSSGQNLLNIEVMRNQSELFRQECKRLILETENVCKRMQDDNKKRLEQHIRDIKFLTKELELKLEGISLEIDVLTALQSRVVKALEACKEPLRITTVCLEERGKRFPSERLHDAVDRELLNERELFERVISLLQHVVEQITEQIRLNRSAKYYLEKDLKEKSEAQRIDDTCTLMTAHSSSNHLKLKNSSSVLHSLAVTPEQWENISIKNITKAEQQKTNSLTLRTLVESILDKTAVDMQKQFEATTTAFQMNVQEIKNAKSQMEDQLAKIQSEYASQQKISEDLQVAITENESFLSLAQTRLDLRCQRPAKEQSHDRARSQLLAEVQQLTTHISKLREAVAQSEEEQRALVRCQLELQENSELKASSLYIDEVICTQHRKPIVIHKF
ncbi:tektin-1 [Betta splendens]|uniref:Tektin n=1 Tax=Betta splendens TaxID=158456 RepID=A0A6P7P779_BETSP|nr:tektin-1 [Betta splendens]